MFTVAEINEYKRLIDLRLLWKSLWQRTRRASFFQSIEWLESYWRSYGDGQKLRVLVVSVAGRPIGIVPFVVKQVTSSLGTVRVLTYPLDNWGAYYGPIGPNPAATLLAAMRHLRDSRRDWDLIDLRYIDADTVDHGRTRNAMRSSGLGGYERPCRDTAVVDLDTSWPEYWDDRPSSLRQAYDCGEEQLSAIGRVKYVRHRPENPRVATGGLGAAGDADPRWDLFAAFEQNAGKLTGCNPDPTGCNPWAWGRGSHFSKQEVDFLWQTHAAAVRAGTADLNVLYVDEMPVACAYNYHRDGILEGVGFGVNAQAHGLQPVGFPHGLQPVGFPHGLQPVGLPAAGTVLMGRMLQDSFRRGDRSYAVSRQRGDFASGWQTSMVTTARYTHFARTVPRAQMLRLNHCITRWLGHNSTAPAAANTSVLDRRRPVRKRAVVN